MPERIRSDNGTNMTRADKDLKIVMQKWRCNKHIHHELLKKQIEWIFNPPRTSHMGEYWERQIKTVDEERLQTLFCEVEAVINGRPITPASEDPNHLEACNGCYCVVKCYRHLHLPIFFE
ncbi:hypothetical protein Pcinc_021775 [Petrolisthes cinctipes]|uniref:Integrase catalytic domain-containing protein n=1 Tax=Petrolisthes cinctipes TaxID=88211 RepID=A0AAE1FGQ8_PETCI|nr:hypothetical protein Pcinc_021775 [Petrolisthes cinctipes]